MEVSVQACERELLSDQNAKMPLAAHPSLSVLKRAGYFCILSPVREKIDCDYWSRSRIMHSHIRDILRVIYTQESLNTV